MSRFSTAFVLGYHGCDRCVAEKAIQGEIDILQSDREFDWLGPGAYFWESDPLRAQEWAEQKAKNGFYSEPAVVGAVIDLRNCLNLLERENIEYLRGAHASFIEHQRKAGLEVPRNKKIPGRPDQDRSLRYLDRAVIKHLHSRLDAQPPGPNRIEPFDSVRGMFVEGDEVYEGCGFKERSHVQLAVRNPDCIIGLFKPRRNPN